MNIQTITFLIVNLLYSTTGFADGYIETIELKNSDFLQYKLQCTLDVPIERVVPETWNAILDSSFSPLKRKKTILDTKTNVVIMHTYITLPYLFDDRDIVTCGKWEHKEGFEGDRMSWKVCERHDAPPSQGAIRILKSNGSWSFNSNI